MNLSELLRKLADLLDAKDMSNAELDKDISFIGPSQTELELKKLEAGVDSAFDEGTDELDDLKRLSGYTEYTGKDECQ